MRWNSRSGATSAVPWLAQMERNTLVAALLSRLAGVLAEFDDTGFAPFTERWNLLHAWQGQHVKILDNGQLLQQGVAVGVDELGRLLLHGADGVQHITCQATFPCAWPGSSACSC